MKKFLLIRSLSVSLLFFCVCLSSASVFAGVNPNDKAKEPVLSTGATGDWEELSRTDEDVWYISMKGISRSSKNIFKVWSRRVPGKGSKSLSGIQGILEKRGKDSKGYAFTKVQFEIDCAKKVYRILTSLHLDRKEKEIEAFNYPNAEWKLIEPDSVPEFIRSDLCEEGKKGK